MRNCLIAILLLVAIVSGCSQPRDTTSRQNTATAAGSVAEPPIPFEDPGACPFEGCTYREWVTTASVKVLMDRRDDAPVAFELAAGDHVTAVTGVVIVTSPGIVEFSEPTDVDATDGPIHMLPGETLYLLTNLGEGYVKGWAHGRLYTDVDATAVRAKRIASYTWWVQVRNAKGQIGWTRHPEAFDGKDALA